MLGRRRRGHRMGFGVREKFWTCVCQGGFSLPPFPSSSILVGIHVLPPPPFLLTPSYRPYLFDFSSTPLGHTNHPWKNAPRENQIISRKTSVSENAPINFPSWATMPLNIFPLLVPTLYSNQAENEFNLEQIIIRAQVCGKSSSFILVGIWEVD